MFEEEKKSELVRLDSCDNKSSYGFKGLGGEFVMKKTPGILQFNIYIYNIP